jgi:anti-sigma-K factor RskA
MQPEDDQQLWDLLGRTAEPKLSPFFARNVLREIRPEASRFGRAQNWFSLRRLVAASGVAVVVIGLAIATHAPRWSQESPEREPDVVAKIDAKDFDVVADLDELLAWDEDNLWNETPAL